jgi:hypothetical protein
MTFELHMAAKRRQILTRGLVDLKRYCTLVDVSSGYTPTTSVPIGPSEVYEDIREAKNSR